MRIGWPDQFIEHATTVDYLREKYGLTAARTVAQVKAEFTLLRKAGRPLVPEIA